MNSYIEPEISEELRNKVSHLNILIKKIEKRFIDYEIGNIPKDSVIDYKKHLNNHQLQVATNTEGPMLVVAGAGTGKTRALVYRAAYLIENGIEPQNILLLTFTRNAAVQMLDKIRNISGCRFFTDDITEGTFHSFANYIIRNNPTVFNISKNFSILDTPDSEDIIEFVCKTIDISDINLELPDKKTLLKVFSISKNSIITIDKTVDRKCPQYSKFKTYFNEVYKLYEKYKQEHDQFDFDDLLVVLLKVLKDNKDFKEFLQEKYRYIMVDEYQDTNVLQAEIIHELADKYKNIMVVGDDSQSIYSFRGASIENILTFPEKYKNCKLIKLEENYRSNCNILNLANSITEQFKYGYKKNLFSSKYRIWLPKIVPTYHGKGEATLILELIRQIRLYESNNFRLNDIAVLFRSSHNSIPLQLVLNERKIKYKLFGGMKFSEKKPIKDIIAHLRIVFNPSDTVSWNRVLTLIPGVGNKTASPIINSILKNNNKLDPSQFENKHYYGYIAELNEIFGKSLFEDYDFHAVLKKICNYYKTVLKVIDDDYRTREEDIKYLLLLADTYTEITDFLADFSLNPPDASDDISNALTLSTVHSAKGLEWKYVFIIHMNENNFPNRHAQDSFEQLEEEKRLFYVACTRAKEQLVLTVPASTGNKKSIASRFISYLPKDIYKLESIDYNLSKMLKLK